MSTAYCVDGFQLHDLQDHDFASPIHGHLPVTLGNQIACSDPIQTSKLLFSKEAHTQNLRGLVRTRRRSKIRPRIPLSAAAKWQATNMRSHLLADGFRNTSLPPILSALDCFPAFLTLETCFLTLPRTHRLGMLCITGRVTSFCPRPRFLTGTQP